MSTESKPSNVDPTSPDTTTELTRRGWLTAAGGVVAAASLHAASADAAAQEPSADWKIAHGRIRQSAVQWCFDSLPIETLARGAAALGMQSVELVEVRDWPVLKQHGLICALSRSHGFVRGLNNKAHHPECIELLTAAIDASSAAGFPSVITFSGMREGLSDEEGIRNTIDGIKQVIGLAEKKQVNICLEPLNTRVNIEMKGHPGYQCDRVEWAIEVCEKVGSPRMKVLFDIYHTQIMQGDVITRIRQYKDYIAHYHTAGVPGRNDLDDLQEINYPAVMQAIVETGYQGYVGQEFIPKGNDKLAALRHAARLCDV